jgi:hypothetical protein
VVNLPSEVPIPDEYRALLRRDLVSFAQLCFSELNPRTRFAMSWHIEIIAAKLTALRGGKIRRLIINLPPRHLKSLLASIAFRLGVSGMIPRRRSSASAMRRISPTNCRAIAGISSPATGTGGSFRPASRRSAPR